MSPGLIYQYFVDKRDIFAALLLESQQELTAFIAEQPRDQGVSALIAAIVPETTKQWARVGHVASVWRTTEKAENSDSQSVQDLRQSTTAQFAELRTALETAARAQGLSLREGPSLIPFVWAGLMGLADTCVNNWAQNLDMSDYIAYSADGLARAITH
jgi:AcrR family transcriptional regulator